MRLPHNPAEWALALVWLWFAIVGAVALWTRHQFTSDQQFFCVVVLVMLGVLWFIYDRRPRA